MKSPLSILFFGPEFRIQNAAVRRFTKDANEIDQVGPDLLFANSFEEDSNDRLIDRNDLSNSPLI